MSANWNTPALTDLYTNFLAFLKDRDVDLALMFDGVTPSNLPTGAIRWNSVNNRFEKWSGTAWVELTTAYAINADKVDTRDASYLLSRTNHTGTQATTTITGLTASSAELNILDGALVTTAELNILDGALITTAELNKLDNITSSPATLAALSDTILLRGTDGLAHVGTLSLRGTDNAVGSMSVSSAAITLNDGAGAQHQINSNGMTFDASGTPKTAWHSGNLSVSSGTWTPTLQDLSLSDAEGQVYAAQDGFYTRIGNMCFFTGRVYCTNLGTLNTAEAANIAGLPFTSLAGHVRSGGVFIYYGARLALPSASTVIGEVFSGGSYIRLNIWNAATGTAQLTVGQFSAFGELHFSGFYTIA